MRMKGMESRILLVLMLMVNGLFLYGLANMTHGAEVDTLDAPDILTAETDVEAAAITDWLSDKRPVRLDWSRVPRAEGYNIYCSGHMETELVKINTEPIREPHYELAVKKGSILYYRVVAVAGEEESLYSPWARVCVGMDEGIRSVHFTSVYQHVEVGKDYLFQAEVERTIDQPYYVRFQSSDPEILEIEENGLAIPKEPGKVYLYARAENGLTKKIQVTVTARQVRMPDLLGLTESEARSEMEAKSLNLQLKSRTVTIEELRRVYKAGVFFGQIAGQDVKAGKKIDSQSRVCAILMKPDRKDPDTRRAVDMGGQMAWPTPGAYTITSNFGHRLSPGGIGSSDHKGLDIGASFGDSVIAAMDGEVVLSGLNYGYGKCVIVDHGDGLRTLYGHLSQLNCQVGDQVETGDTIGKVGSTGDSTGPHLHFGVVLKERYVNPILYLFGKNSSIYKVAARDAKAAASASSQSVEDAHQARSKQIRKEAEARKKAKEEDRERLKKALEKEREIKAEEEKAKDAASDAEATGNTDLEDVTREGESAAGDDSDPAGQLVEPDAIDSDKA